MKGDDAVGGVFSSGHAGQALGVAAQINDVAARFFGSATLPKVDAGHFAVVGMNTIRRGGPGRIVFSINRFWPPNEELQVGIVESISSSGYFSGKPVAACLDFKGLPYMGLIGYFFAGSSCK